MLATAEVELYGSRQINKDLHERFPIFSYNALKGKRRDAKYKALVNDLLLVRSVPRVPPVLVPDFDDVQLEDVLSASLDLTSTSDLNPLAIPFVPGQVQEPEVSFQAYFEDLRNSADPVVSSIASLAQRLDPALLVKVDEFATSIPRKRPRPRRPQHRPQAEHQKRQRRRLDKRALYKEQQRLFHQDPRRLASDIFDGNDVTTTFPTEEDVRQVFGNLFSSESPPDDDGFLPKPLREPNWYPVTPAELTACLHGRRDTAPGPDGLLLSDIKKVPIQHLCVLFNAVLYYGDVPASFKVSRTVLIPKKGDTALATNWRPITVSSVLQRALHLVLSSRLIRSLSLNLTQQAFLPVDGLQVNTALLDHLISDAKKKIKALCITSLDIAKAFDSVSHYSLARALRRLGVEDALATYILASYKGCTTSITCGPVTIPSLPVTRGVKQGDPLSPILFNAVIDELFDALPKYIGATVGNTLLNSLGFADDTCLISNTENGMRELLRVSQAFFTARHLRVNAAKCFSLVWRKDGKKKKLLALQESVFSLDGVAIPPVSHSTFLRYLGVIFAPDGKSKPDFSSYERILGSLAKACLKPNQKITLLRQYLLPRYIHLLTMSHFTCGSLQAFDRLTKSFVRRVLALPHYSPEGFFFAGLRAGGLGLLSARYAIPFYSHRRLTNMATCALPAAQAYCNLPAYFKAISRAQSFLGGLQPTAQAIKTFWLGRLCDTVYGNGLDVGDGSVSHSWIRDTRFVSKGFMYQKLIKTRLNLLPCRGSPANQGDKHCRTGCGRIESLSHISQRCAAGHLARIARHNKIVNWLASHGRAKGFEVHAECRLVCTSGDVRKPDLLFVRGNELYLVDVTIPWETTQSLNHHYQQKVTYYSQPQVLEQLHLLFPACAKINIGAFVISARGLYCGRNDEVSLPLGISPYSKRFLCLLAIEGTHKVYTQFMKAV